MDPPRLAWPWLFAAAAGLAVFGTALEDVYDGGRFVGLDQPAGALAAGTPPVLLDALRLVSWLGSSVVVVPAMLLVAWLFWRRGHHREAARGLVALLAVNVASQATKLLVARPRPLAEFGGPFSDAYSFPSAHAASAALLACLALWWVQRDVRGQRWALAVAGVGIAWALLVATSRVALGAHWLSDVVAGAGLGVGIAGLAIGGPAAWRALRGHGQAQNRPAPPED